MGFRISSMDTCSSGEELTVKARKPYTITKQRERWTEEEHNRFLEAIKLYGRAWQRIEEHIGTKTAVQIRSHAQKFFTKLEKEALSKGISLKQAIDIEIPPPRPKRKPSIPYPRKICLGTTASSKEANSESPSISISSDQSKTLQLKNGTSPENLAGSDCSERTKVVSEKGNCSETLTLFHDVPRKSFASEKRNSGSPQSFRKFVPSPKEIKKQLEFDKSAQTANENKKATQCTADSTDNDIGFCLNLQPNVAPLKRHVQHKPEEEGSNCELQDTTERERHLSVHSTDKNNENCMRSDPQIATSATTKPGTQVYPNPSVVDPSVMVNPEDLIHSTASFHQELPTFPSFTLFHNNQDASRSFFNMSSTFSNFILSTLLQNPAAHAAASLAASFWSSVGDTTNSASEVLNNGVPSKHTNTSLNMAAIASATVAAATAWWATHGLFPLCHPPLSNGFAIAMAPTATIPSNFTNLSPEERVGTKGDNSLCQAQQDEHVLDSESPEAPGIQRSTSKSVPMSSSDSESGGDKPRGSEGNGSEVKELLTPKIGNECGDNTRNAKRTSICSCGSNKLSSTENEIKTALDGSNKLEIHTESKEPENYSLLSETKYRRLRNSESMNESWKEVSEEGRIAFQALFSREVLPQSFSPPDVEETDTNLNNVTITRTPVNLSINVFADEVLDHVPPIECGTSNSSHHSTFVCKSGLGKLRANHTGFQPYKRCSMEAENTTSVGDEKTSKRSRLDEEASTR